MSDGEFQKPYPLENYRMLIIDYSDANETMRMHEFPKTQSMTGIELIAQERLEQKIKHRRSVKSDYELNPDFELCMAAEAVLTGNVTKFSYDWDDEKCEKMISKPYLERLIIAGALIAAEIDRINYKE